MSGPSEDPEPGADGLVRRDGEAVSSTASSDELPVVARMVVEIRSDGRRTIARGALEDPDGQRVTVEAKGTTPWALAKQLAGAMWTLPRLRRRRPSLRALLSGRRHKDEG